MENMEEEHTTAMAGFSGSTTRRPRPVMIERNFTFPDTSSRASVGTSDVNSNSNQPLTIFFNGAVGIFHLSSEQAEYIMEMAEKASMEEGSMAKGNSSSSQQELVAKLREGMHMARKRSLQRFLEKRKERLTTPDARLA